MSNGAAAGPLMAAGFNHLFGVRGLFLFTLLVATATIVITLWRMQQRDSIAVEEQTAYASVPNTSPAVLELAPEIEKPDE